MRHPLGVRTRLLITVVASVTAALALMTVGFNVLLARSLSRDADRVVMARAAAEASSIDIVNGKVVTKSPEPGGLDGQAWVFSDGRAAQQPRVGRVLYDAAMRLATTPGRTRDVAQAHARLYSMKTPELPGVVVVAGVSLMSYQHTQRVSLEASLVFAAVLTLLIALVTRWTLRAALHPVAQMTADAEVWSETDPARRFAAGEPYDELSQLAATLDRLFARLSASLLREQRFSAEMSHELRTPLARVRTEAELALRRERTPADYRSALRTIVENADQMSAVMDTLLAAARQQSGAPKGRSDVGLVLAGVTGQSEVLADERDVELDVRRPAERLSLGLDADMAIRVIQPIVENACHLAASRVTVSAAGTDGAVLVSVDDDGPGVKPDEAEAIFAPGARGSAADGLPGAGLGLALARRLARAAGGDVTAFPGTGGRFVARLPRV